jgi:hypothetical protein
MAKFKRDNLLKRSGRRSRIQHLANLNHFRRWKRRKK